MARIFPKEAEFVSELTGLPYYRVKCKVLCVRTGYFARYQKHTFTFYLYVTKIKEYYVGRTTMEMKLQVRRKRGRPRRRWLDKVKDDIKEKELSADDVYDSAALPYIDPT